MHATADVEGELRALARRRWHVGATLSVAMMAIYFGFTLLVAFNKPLMGALAAPGLSLGIGLGALIIVFAWLLTGIYVRWANGPYDAAIARLRRDS